MLRRGEEEKEERKRIKPNPRLLLNSEDWAVYLATRKIPYYYNVSGKLWEDPRDYGHTFPEPRPPRGILTEIIENELRAESLCVC